MAASVTNLVAGATKSLTIDLGVLVEGQAVGELPEQLLGTMRLERWTSRPPHTWMSPVGGCCAPGTCRQTAAYALWPTCGIVALFVVCCLYSTGPIGPGPL